MVVQDVSVSTTNTKFKSTKDTIVSIEITPFTSNKKRLIILHNTATRMPQANTFSLFFNTQHSLSRSIQQYLIFHILSCPSQSTNPAAKLTRKFDKPTKIREPIDDKSFKVDNKLFFIDISPFQPCNTRPTNPNTYTPNMPTVTSRN